VAPRKGAGGDGGPIDPRSLLSLSPDLRIGRRCFERPGCRLCRADGAAEQAGAPEHAPSMGLLTRRFSWGRPPTEASLKEKPWLVNRAQQCTNRRQLLGKPWDVVRGSHAEAAVAAGHNQKDGGHPTLLSPLQVVHSALPSRAFGCWGHTVRSLDARHGCARRWAQQRPRPRHIAVADDEHIPTKLSMRAENPLTVDATSESNVRAGYSKTPPPLLASECSTPSFCPAKGFSLAS
jgi:hypothetical protein